MLTHLKILSQIAATLASFIASAIALRSSGQAALQCAWNDGFEGIRQHAKEDEKIQVAQLVSEKENRGVAKGSVNARQNSVRPVSAKLRRNSK